MEGFWLVNWKTHLDELAKDSKLVSKGLKQNNRILKPDRSLICNCWLFVMMIWYLQYNISSNSNCLKLKIRHMDLITLLQPINFIHYV